MPSGMAAVMREALDTENKEDLELEKSPWSKAGFKNVILIKVKYQTRLQVPGDGRGGITKRKQHALPGLFDTAEDAAAMLAFVKRDMLAACVAARPSPRQSRTRSTSPATNR